MTHINSKTQTLAAHVQKQVEPMEFNLNTIIFLIGPDGSGKTHFAKNSLIPQLKSHQVDSKKIKISYIGIDDISCELLGETAIYKYSNEFSKVSDQAYEILIAKINAVTSYPVNSDFVIVDTQGFDEQFRERVREIADEKNYDISLIMFNYQNKEQYFQIDGLESHKRFAQIKQMKHLVSGGISRKGFNSIYTIESRDFGSYKIKIDDYSMYEMFLLDDKKEYIVIGDIHGCLDEFKALLELNGFVIDQDDKVSHSDGIGVVLVGDIIDKGYNIKGVIDFVYKNIEFFKVVIGNHENFVNKVLSGILKKGDMPSKEVVDTYFGTIALLQESEAPVKPSEPTGKNKDNAVAWDSYDTAMQKYEEKMKEFIPLTPEDSAERADYREKFDVIMSYAKNTFIHKDFVVTHVSCDNKFLGKINTNSLKAARDFRIPKVEEFLEDGESYSSAYSKFIFAFDERIQFVKDQAREHHPLHIFGHVETTEVSRYMNKINIDTACVAGGKLTSIFIDKFGKVSYKSVPAGLRITKEEEQKFNFFN